ncbi:transporter substrate-binding domain-containing protein [Pseudalkalibacillus sp. SCS-8]|uniref:transporter substrate-binding domain-containing protein n=1 Tax=Pseudalkalibacillus nanhaiensis TaxID=3115291 RepID=UPI0032DBBF6E
MQHAIEQMKTHSAQLESGHFFNPSAGVYLKSRLDVILQRGRIRVGTTGDYKPYSYLDSHTHRYEGYDIDVARHLGDQLGVHVEFIKTSWPTIMEDLRKDCFDISMGGISRNLERQKIAHLTRPYVKDGKAPLMRYEDHMKFTCLMDIDQPGVKIGLNPGGTNERFVRKHVKNADILICEDNLMIPGMVAEGKVDVMITDHVEASLYAKKDERLYAALGDNPFTRSEKVYMLHRGDLDYQNWIALWMEEMEEEGTMERLKVKWGLNQSVR